MECQDDIEDLGNEIEGEADMDAGSDDMGFDGGIDADLEAEKCSGKQFIDKNKMTKIKLKKCE